MPPPHQRHLAPWMRALRGAPLLVASACTPKIPNPVDVAGVAIDLTLHGLDEAHRAARRAGRTAPSPGEWNASSGPVEVVTPSASSPVEARFTGESGESRWSVRAAGAPVCETPCALRYPEGTALTLVHADAKRRPVRLDVPSLRAGTYDIEARPRQNGAFGLGAVAASFGGMGSLVGLVLTPVGCSQGSDAMCKGGLITAAVSGAVLALGIVLVSGSLPRVRVERTARSLAP